VDAAGDTTQRSESPGPPASNGRARAEQIALVLIALLVAKRLAYHLAYLVADPFALATFSDGQIYEDAARDILAHPPFGSQPFYLQGLYAYLLAAPMALANHVVLGLLLQLVLAAGALWLFYRVATAQLGQLEGALSTACLLACSELAFYENKYLSVSLGISCNIAALFVATRAFGARRFALVVAAGVAGGLCMLARPNMALALPFTAGALLVTRAQGQRVAHTLLAFTAGVVIALAPMALRNQLVIGRFEVFPSHAGAIPFYLGNNPLANGRWNNAGGLISGQVGREREELAARLGLSAPDPAELDRAIARELWGRSRNYIAQHPGDWLRLELKKLWLTIGNHRFVRDYDLRGEAELIGSAHQLGLPFGALLALGALGTAALLRRAARVREERKRWLALLLVLAGQIAAVLAANLLVFTSAQNRVPLVIPLAFLSGPAVLGLFGRVRQLSAATWELGAGALALSALLFAQACWPRLPEVERPSSVHYFNLAAVEEAIGRDAAAAEHYHRAVERNPREPIFQLREADVLRRLGRRADAAALLDRLDARDDIPRAVRSAVAQERKALTESP
jgi:tetratricopeptide (TPR) repeat protein